MLEQAGITPQVDQLPIFGMTRANSLAVRHRLKDGQVRQYLLLRSVESNLGGLAASIAAEDAE